MLVNTCKPLAELRQWCSTLSTGFRLGMDRVMAPRRAPGLRLDHGHREGVLVRSVRLSSAIAQPMTRRLWAWISPSARRRTRIRDASQISSESPQEKANSCSTSSRQSAAGVVARSIHA